MDNPSGEKKRSRITKFLSNMSGKGESIYIDIVPILFFVLGFLLLLIFGFSIFISN
jgi:hypothetical protein